MSVRLQDIKSTYRKITAFPFPDMDLVASSHSQEYKNLVIKLIREMKDYYKKSLSQLGEKEDFNTVKVRRPSMLLHWQN